MGPRKSAEIAIDYRHPVITTHFLALGLAEIAQVKQQLERTGPQIRNFVTLIDLSIKPGRLPVTIKPEPTLGVRRVVEIADQVAASEGEIQPIHLLKGVLRERGIFAVGILRHGPDSSWGGLIRELDEQIRMRPGRPNKAPFIVWDIFQRYIREKPGEPIIFREIAREAGVSVERVRQIYQELSPFRDLPQVKVEANRAKLEADKKRVLDAREKRADLIGRVVELRDQNLGDTKIAQELNITKPAVTWILTREHQSGEAKRLRKRRRDKWETKAFREKLSGYWDAGLSIRQIANETGDTRANVWSYLRRSLAQGKIRSRKPVRH